MELIGIILAWIMGIFLLSGIVIAIIVPWGCMSTTTITYENHKKGKDNG